MLKKKDFFLDYFKDFRNLLLFNNQIINKLSSVKKKFLKLKSNNNKILIFGNGGSASIASHFSTDITKFTKIKCVNFNEANLITCFANDYGYENWAAKSIDFYGQKGDILIAISSSGRSKNIINACKAAKRKKFSFIVTFSGFKKNNPLSKLGNINFWIKSDIYNFVENIHQILLLSIVDSLKK
jgi:D-sedoheptulose 7-phosphate isomerase